jgi:hypothetical protein
VSDFLCNPEYEVICSSEISVDFHRTTWRYILEARTLEGECYANLRKANNRPADQEIPRLLM